MVGTPNIEGAIGLSAAVDYLSGIGMENVRNHEKDLIEYTLKMEEEYAIPDMVSYGPTNLISCTILSFINIETFTASPHTGLYSVISSVGFSIVPKLCGCL